MAPMCVDAAQRQFFHECLDIDIVTLGAILRCYNTVDNVICVYSLSVIGAVLTSHINNIRQCAVVVQCSASLSGHNNGFQEGPSSQAGAIVIGQEGQGQEGHRRRRDMGIDIAIARWC